MAVVTMRQLLEAGVHFGHQTRRWNPKMRRFILGERNGIYIIDLRQTLEGIEEAYGYIRDLVADGGTILFVGTKKQTQDPIASYAAACGMPYVNERWLGGMLTNFNTISARVKQMQEYEAMERAGDFEAMPKKEALRLSRELEKLQRNLGGIRDLDRLPDAVFVIDTKKEHIAVTEANKLGMPIVAVVDTNCDPDVITYVIPGNDDAIRSGALLCRVIADAVVEGRFIAQQRPAPEPPAPTPAAPPRLPLRPRPSPRLPLAEAAGSCRRRSCGCRSRPRPLPRLPLPAPEAAAPAPAAEAAPAPRPPPRLPPAQAAGRSPSCRSGPPPRPPPAPAQRKLSDGRFTAKDVQTLRQSTGAGMLDAKQALEETDGDFEKAVEWLREQGLASQAKRADREAAEVRWPWPRRRRGLHRRAAVRDRLRGQVRRVRAMVADLADLVAAEGEAAVDQRSAELDDLKTRLKENISLGQVVRFEAPADGAVDSYLHMQAGRGVNAVLVAVAGGTAELAHDIAVHIAFARPSYITREEVPEAEVAAERETVEKIARNEGKPEAALPKIVEGRMNGWFKERVLLDQPYAKDEKQTIAKLLGPATVTRFAQVVVGG